MATTEFDQGRVRVNEHGARLLQRLLSMEIEEKLKLRRLSAPMGGVGESARRQQSQEINRARRVLQEVERVIAERWGNAG